MLTSDELAGQKTQPASALPRKALHSLTSSSSRYTIRDVNDRTSLSDYEDEWQDIVGISRCKEDEPLTRLLDYLNMDALTLFLRDNKSSGPSCRMEDLYAFCQGGQRALHNPCTSSSAERKAAWLDDRTRRPLECAFLHRQYRNPLTASQLRAYLEQSRFNANSQEPDGDRRLIYISGFDSEFAMALIHSVSEVRRIALRDSMWRHISDQTLMRIRPIQDPAFMFILELNMPFYVFEENVVPQSGSAWPQARCIDLSFLQPGTSNVRDSAGIVLRQAMFSILICVSGEDNWIAYAFDDTQIGLDGDDLANERSWWDDCGSSMHEDPIAGSEVITSAELPFWCPREYFVRILESRTRQVLESWTDILSRLERRINRVIDGDYRHSPPSRPSIITDALKSHHRVLIEWSLDTLKLLAHLQASLTSLGQAWQRFACSEGDLGYLKGLSAHSRRAIHRCRTIFYELQQLEDRLSALSVSCQNLVCSLQLTLAFESNEYTHHSSLTAMFTITLFMPLSLASSFFSMPDHVIPFKISSKSFIGVWIVMSIITVALFTIGVLSPRIKGPVRSKATNMHWKVILENWKTMLVALGRMHMRSGPDENENVQYPTSTSSKTWPNQDSQSHTQSITTHTLSDSGAPPAAKPSLTHTWKTICSFHSPFPGLAKLRNPCECRIRGVLVRLLISLSLLPSLLTLGQGKLEPTQRLIGCFLSYSLCELEIFVILVFMLMVVDASWQEGNEPERKSNSRHRRSLHWPGYFKVYVVTILVLYLGHLYMVLNDWRIPIQVSFFEWNAVLISQLCFASAATNSHGSTPTPSADPVASTWSPRQPGIPRSCDSEGLEQPYHQQEDSRGQPITSDDATIQPADLWIVSIFTIRNQGRPLTHIDARAHKTDLSLFNALHQHYHKSSSALYRLFQLRAVGKIYCARFSLFCNNQVGIVKPDVWPTAQEPMWQYEPRPAPLDELLVSTDHLLIAWRNPRLLGSDTWQPYVPRYLCGRFIRFLKDVPHRWKSQNATFNAHCLQTRRLDEEQPNQHCRNYIWQRLPKKIGKRVEHQCSSIEATQAYGLVFEESFMVHRLLFFILLLYAAGSLAVSVWLIRKYGASSGANSLDSFIGMVAWLGSLLALAVTVWFKWAEN